MADRVLTFLGRAFLRYGKAVLPLTILAAYSLAVPKEQIFGSESLERALDGAALAVVLLGLTLRALAAGGAAISETDRLVGDGVYGLSRNPRYLGGLLICIGIFLMHGAPSVIVFGTAACALVYALMVRVEEGDLNARYGERYRAYRAKVPRWVPGPTQIRRSKADIDFDVRRALAADWPAIAGTAVLMVFTEVHESLSPPLAASSQTVVIALTATLAVCAALAIALRTAGADPGARAPAGTLGDALHFAGPTTRGLRVDGRVRLVDWLEDMLSLGQQEAILETTLAAAELGPGERLVDVGCGTGKLAVAAAGRLGDRYGRPSHVLGIDATPGMIDLALKRAHDAGVAAEFQVGIAEALPLPDGAADAVTSSYFFHHLPSDVKPEALREMWRVLAPGGRLVIADYGRAHGLVGLIASVPMRANFYEYVRPQLNGELERMIAAEGLGAPEIVRRYLGYITIMRLRKPA